jgi:phosphoenolpyruvate synthase/pyruvate phosphate dikinase
MELTRDFKNIDKNDVSLAGGKGASLGEMTQASMPVPNGFVIVSNAFENFLEETYLNITVETALDSIDYKKVHTVEHASEKIKTLILQAEIPKNIKEEIQRKFKDLNSKYVAVRSSATSEDSTNAAWAGQLESYLNTTEETLLENVKRCWASLFMPRAIFYRFEKKLHKQKISVAVVVQKMVESEKSGIAFSVHPVTQNKNQLIIEAGLGLGETIASGQITPDSYVIEKQPRRITYKNVRTKKQILTNSEILELSDLILKIENHYGFPCDIEWAFEKRKFYIVQSRPITTLNPDNSKKLEIKYKNNFLRKILTKTLGPRKVIFEKISRDTTYIMQEMWAYGCFEALEKKYGWRNPYVPGIINHMNHGSIEVWENVKATRWLSNTILSKNIEAPEFMDEILKKYKESLLAIHKLWKEKILPMESLKKLIEISKEALVYYVPYYYSTLDDRTPKAIKEKVIETREKDDLFAKNDIIIRDSLINLYPELRGYETTIFYDELDSIPSIDILKKRRESFFTIQGEGRFMTTLDEFKRIYPNFVLKEDVVKRKNLREIKGQIAQKGKAIGKVKILRRRDQISEVAEGDVIVSPMTTTDFLPAILKSVAIITDEGGITCHAAIVARELKKPCIIGTKIATQILRDGDLVEVDADDGIVRIL